MHAGGENDPVESQTDYDKRMGELADAGFLKGFAMGVGYGGLDMITSTGQAIAGTARFVGRGTLQVGLRFRWAYNWMTNGDNTLTNEMIVQVDAKQQAVVEHGLELGKFLGTLLVDTAAILPKVEVGLLTGDVELVRTALQGSETHRKIFEMTAEVLAQTATDLTSDGRSPGQKGYVIGRIVYEAASFLLPFTKAGTLMQATKAQMLQRLINRTGPVLKAGIGNARDVAMGVKIVCEAGCFESGTLTLTQTGLKKIELVKTNDLVWACDETNPENAGWKRVLRTFTHHASRLHRISITRGGEEPFAVQETETFGVTSEHPFWIVREGDGRFIRAQDVRPGDRMLGISDVEATVTMTRVSDAPVGQLFTTHNFEVEDSHTYHVGRSSVLVHNMQGCPLQRAFDELFGSLLASGARHRGGVNPANILQELAAKRGKALSQQERAVIVNSIINGGLEKYKDAGLLDAHFVDLAMEAGEFKGKEAFAAVRFETKTGKSLMRGPNNGVDFVEGDVPWDAVGPFPVSGIDNILTVSLPNHVARNHNGVPCNVILDLAGLPVAKQKYIMKTVALNRFKNITLAPGQKIEFITDF